MSYGYVLGLAECTEDCAQVVGGKASGLGALLREGLQVPPGFAVTADAYREHVRHNKLTSDIERLLAESPTSYEAQVQTADRIRELFDASMPAPAVDDEIRRAYEDLCRDPMLPVAVRSSGTMEDTAQASFAGQQDTYLFIVGASEVLRYVLRCWSSLFTAQAMAYRARLQTDVTDLAMGVVVQRMVAAEAAGVMMTLNPIDGDRSGIMLEAAYGLGAAVVNGEVDPDRFFVDKSSLQIRSRALGMKTVAHRFDPSGQGTRTEEVPSGLQAKPSIADEEVCELARAGIRMEAAMGAPQDIEWAIGPGDNATREIFLLQARPETIWSHKTIVA